MPILDNYQQFNGRHWETGTISNYWAYHGITAPHTGQPYSEALLLGVSGGIVMGYFTFIYEGCDPQARILTRNTFDPLDSLLSRLGVVQHRLHTANPQKGVANLIKTLEAGDPAIVWADYFTLPYNAFPYDEGMWAMFPILVYGYDEAADIVYIADRAPIPLTISTELLAQARARVKKDKFRILTLDPPIPDKLPGAVQAGIWDCLKLFTEKPPKGSKNNFGLAAYRHWVKMLTQPKTRRSWAREFPPGRPMLAGLAGVFNDINCFGNIGFAERDLYADFLVEASTILGRPGLKEAAGIFRQSAQAWDQLGKALLPQEVPLLGEMGQLLLAQRDVMRQKGSEAVEELQQLKAKEQSLYQQAESNFPFDEAEAEQFRGQLAEQILRLHDIEETAVTILKDAMTNI